MAVCPPKFELDDGGIYQLSKFQEILYGWWGEFWTDFVRPITNDDYVFVCNGDAIDGQVKHSSSNVSINPSTQIKMATRLLKPHVERARSAYIIRGTEAHVGISACHEENLAINLGVPIHEGTFSHWELWLEFHGKMLHFAHHIGAAGSPMAEAGALNREAVNAIVEAGQWGASVPDMIIRSHRHRYMHLSLPTSKGDIDTVVTPAWQLHTPFTHRIGHSIKMPQIGGVVISYEHGELTVRRKIWVPKRQDPRRS